MKQNITLSIDKTLIRKRKIIAAQREASVSKMLSEELEKLIQNTEQYEFAKRKALANLKQVSISVVKLLYQVRRFMKDKIFVETKVLNHGQVIEGIFIENPFL